VVILPLLLVVGGVVFCVWWWSLGSFGRSVDAYEHTLKELAQVSRRGDRTKRVRVDVMPPAHVRVLPTEITPLTDVQTAGPRRPRRPRRRLDEVPVRRRPPRRAAS